MPVYNWTGYVGGGFDMWGQESFVTAGGPPLPRRNRTAARDVSAPLTGGVLGAPVVGAALNSQKAVQMVSTELVWRFNWFGGHY
jgi:hypothetical protein